MGSELSQEDYDRSALRLYEGALQNPCLLPDIGIDESLQKFSGTDSNAVLQRFADDLIRNIPNYMEKLGASLAPMTHNAVGLGALVISMVLEMALTQATPTQTNDDSYSMLRRVFGEEKRSAVRDTMLEYIKRHRTYMRNEQRLRGEIRRFEEQLSQRLTELKSSLLLDGQMSTHGFKIWVNGAAFHTKMLIHEARLNIQAGEPQSRYIDEIREVIKLYLHDLDVLLKKWKSHDTRTFAYRTTICAFDGCISGDCRIRRDDCEINYRWKIGGDPCEGPKVNEPFRNHIYLKYDSELKNHFSNITDNLNSLVNLRGSLRLS